MATIKDVAKRAGVSIATVSNYLNHTKPVSKDASERIRRAVEQLQYTQNMTARTLKSNRYSDIGVILPNLSDSYYVQIFQGIEDYFQNSNYYLSPCFSYDIPDLEQNSVRGLLKKQICGLILVSCQPDNWKFYYDYFTSDGRPLVLIDRDIHSLDANFVSFDNYSIIKDMTLSLLAKGYRDIYLFSGPAKFECELNCINGFTTALIEHRLKADPDFLIRTNMSKEDAFRTTIQLLKSRLPEAVVATSESISKGVIEGLDILGYSTRDIPVYTLGEEHWNLHTHSFATTSAARPAIKLGQTASQLLIEQLNSPCSKESEKIILTDAVAKNSLLSSGLCPASPVSVKPADRSVRLLMLDTPQVHALQGLVKNFENLTGIAADITLLAHHNLYDAIMENREAPADAAYDVVMYDIPWLPALASNKVLEDITPLFSEMDLSVFLPECLHYFSNYNNRYFGMPFMYAPQIFYYRRDLFEDPELRSSYEKQNNMSLRPPRTLKEFNTIASFFSFQTDRIPYGISIPAAYDECLAPEIYMRLKTYGGDLFDAKGQVCLDCAQSLKAYINLLRAIKASKPDYRTATDISAAQDFLKGDTAMLITYPSFLTDVVDLRKSSMTGSIGYHHIPGKNPLLGGWSLGISASSPRKEDALEFLKWTVNDQLANYIALLGGQTALVSSYTNDELVKLYPWLPLYRSTYRYAKPTLPPRYGSRIISQNKIDAIVCKWFYELLDDKIEVQDAIANTHRELEELVGHFSS